MKTEKKVKNILCGVKEQNLSKKRNRKKKHKPNTYSVINQKKNFSNTITLMKKLANQPKFEGMKDESNLCSNRERRKQRIMFDYWLAAD